MKAPEKLYLRKRNKLPLEVVRDELYVTDPQNIYGSVEYLRTDAFIEKTFKFFDEHLWEYITVKNDNCDTHIKIDSDDLKEDFRNYMKGEDV